MKNQTSFEILLFLIGALLIALVVVAAVGGVFKSNKTDALAKALNYKKFSCSPPEVYKYPNLLLALHFDDNSSINDSSRFKASQANYFSTFGVKGGGLILNTTNYSAIFQNPIYNSSVFSLSFWFNITDASSAPATAFLVRSEFLSVNVTSANNLFVQFPGLATSNYPFTVNTWNNIAVQRNYDGSTQVFYNGNLIEKIASTSAVNNTNFTFGAPGNTITAVVDEFKFFNLYLTQDQVLDDLFCGIRN